MAKKCETCGKDISNRKGSVRFCVACANERKEQYRTSRRKNTGLCLICGKLTGSFAKKYCADCSSNQRRYREKAGQTIRHCVICGNVIVGRRYNAKYCLACAEIAKKSLHDPGKAMRMYREGQLRLKKEKEEPVYGDTTQCKTCEYWNKTDKWCDFMSKAGRPRRCEPSPNCTEYRKI